MQVNGHFIKSLIQIETLKLDGLKETLELSMTHGKGETPDGSLPIDICKEMTEVETRIATLQSLQSHYNNNTFIHVNGAKITLTEGIKRLGALSRTAKAIKSIVTNTKPNRRNYYEEGDRVARTSVKDKTEATISVVKDITTLKNIISRANSHEIESPDWFDSTQFK